MPGHRSMKSKPNWLTKIWKTSSAESTGHERAAVPGALAHLDANPNPRLLNVNIPSISTIDLAGPWAAVEPVVSAISGSRRTVANREIFQRPHLHHHRDIRLLRVSRDVQTAKLCGSFAISSLDKPELDFQAISYCWGMSEALEKLWYSPTQYLQVTPSLYSILQLLADEPTILYYWIDALCIDQGNHAEKGHQIRLMRDIFASAEQVVAFIGDSSTDSNHAMRFIDTLHTSIQSTQLLSHSGLLKNISENLNVDMPTIVQNDLTRYPSQSWSALKSLLERPWFQRSWCIQEVVVANKVVLRCGTQTADWQDLAYAMGLLAPTGLAQLSTVDDYGYMQFEGCLNLGATFAIKGFGESSKTMHLQHCLMLANGFKATLPQDKIFSMFGIAIDAVDDELYPNYSISTQALYTNVTQYLFTRDHSLQLLHLAGIGWPRTLPGLPSWAPDFSTRRRSSILGSYELFRAASPVASFVDVNAKSQLISPWLFVDRVAEVARPMPELLRSSDRKGSKHSRSNLIDWFDETAKWAKDLAPYPTGEICEVVYWRTLLCDLPFSLGFAAKKMAYAEYPERFDAMLEILRYSIDSRLPPEAEDALLFLLLEERELLIKILLESRDRILFRTQAGYLGLGPAGLRPKDSLCLVDGTNTPFLLRIRDHDSGVNNDIYNLVGECYVNGIMNGEGRPLGTNRTVILA